MIHPLEEKFDEAIGNGNWEMVLNYLDTMAQSVSAEDYKKLKDRYNHARWWDR